MLTRHCAPIIVFWCSVCRSYWRRENRCANRSCGIQGGSDISGTLSKLHCCIEKKKFLLIILPQTISAVCWSINESKKTHSSKDESTGSYKSCDSLRTSRRTTHERDYRLWKHNKSTVYDIESKFEKFIAPSRSADTVLIGRKWTVLAANLDELITRDLGRSTPHPPPPQRKRWTVPEQIWEDNVKRCTYIAGNHH